MVALAAAGGASHFVSLALWNAPSGGSMPVLVALVTTFFAQLLLPLATAIWAYRLGRAAGAALPAVFAVLAFVLVTLAMYELWLSSARLPLA